MQIHLLLSISSKDKPGVIEAVSSVIESAKASWLESRLAHLSGKFMGMVRIRVDNSQESALRDKLASLKTSGIEVLIEQAQDDEKHTAFNVVRFSAIGPDKTGIVKEVAAAISGKGINIEELETTLTSMPYSGEPIFEAKGLLSVPNTVDIKALFETMDSVANDLGVDLDLESID